MTENQENFTFWSNREWDLINVTDLFKHKPAIMKKAESYLEELRAALIKELKDNPKPFPQGTDQTKGQIARGENHKGFPFLSLDLPQKFSKTDFFTYRTLFWWGHYLGFSLILKGSDLKTYTDRVKKNRLERACEDIYLSRHSSPWEWEFCEEHFSKVSELSDAEIEKIADRLQYLKLIRIYSVEEESFTHLNWVQVGTESFRDLIHMVME
ncbi:MAG: hypothetical protein OEZ51_05975 [Nitrospinota bacterium]|nr:hypothetical protein [Nitrospinota bacterium]